MRATLLVRVLAPLVGLVVLSTVVANHFATSFANKSFDSFLLNSADSIAARVRAGRNGVVLADLPSSSRDLFRHHGTDKFFYQVISKDGHILIGDNCFPSLAPTAYDHSSFGDTNIDGQNVRFCTVPTEISSVPVWIRAGETLNSRTNLFNQIFLSILIPQVVLVGLAGFFVFLGVGQGLRPLHRLCEILRSRTEPDLSPVDLGNTPTELVPVTEALNHLFRIIDSHCKAQRDFIADAAHQLRTPVTALKTYLDHLTQSDDKPIDGKIINQLAAVSHRLADMVNRLLVLARAEARASHTREISEANAAIGDAASAVIHQALRRNIEMHFDLPDRPINVGMSREDLTEVLVNLLDNAIKYIPEKCSIWVSLKKNQSATILDIADDGGGIADEHKEAVFKRFHRLVDTNAPGCGLGLAIVKQICSASNVTITLLDRDGGGCIFRLAFPKCVSMSDTLPQSGSRSTPTVSAEQGILAGRR
jgi:two-component system sensor histidine kinase TctE